MAFHSCKKMADMINTMNFFENDITADDLRRKCEAYGKEVYCYLKMKDNIDRLRFEAWLKKHKITHNREYSPDESTVEFRVSYFKAVNHNR